MGVIFDGVTVTYLKNGEKCERTLKFKDNFRLDINGKQYFSDSGYLYECGTNKEIKVLDFANKQDNATAYQLLGMSCTAESARDYTFSKKDIDTAKSDSMTWIIGESGDSKSDRRSASIIGNGAGYVPLGGTTFEGGKYTTKYISNYKERESIISVWLLDDKE